MKKTEMKPHTQDDITSFHSLRDAAITCETVYYERGGEMLAIDVYRPNADKYPGVRPGILFFFGGGFRVGTRLAFREQAELCAKQGYVAFSADYRISSLYDVTAADSIRDGAAAWSFVRENAAKWGVDPDKIVLAGGSAGGTIAAMCGFLTGIYPAGLILFNPGVLDREDPESLLATLTGWEIDGVEVTNTQSVWPGMAMLVMHGEADQIVPVSTICRYVDYANAHGGNAKLVTYPDAPHGFFNFNRSRAHFLLTMGEALLFLEMLFS